MEEVEKTVDDKPLFSGVTLGMDEGEKVGIVGNNGAGKSVFVSILEGKALPDEGRISFNQNIEVSVLSQKIAYSEGATLSSFLHEDGSKKIKTLHAYSKALAEGNEKEYQRLQLIIEKEGLWSVETDYDAFLTELGLGGMMDRKMSSLSGGELKKAALARMFSLRPGLMVMDEPTNHLDIRTIEYLEKFIKDSSLSVIIVSHDRYLLTNVCTTIWELDGGKFYTHPGSYEAYVERKEARLEAEGKEQARLKTILRRELAWLRRGPQARTGKDKNRKERIEDMLSMQHETGERKQNKFQSSSSRLGKKILDIKGVGAKAGGKLLFSPFSYAFKKGDKIGVVGDNGTGKSTLLDIISGIREPDEGLIDRGINTKFGYYDQLSRGVDTSKTPLEFISSFSERIPTPDGEMSADRFLERFGIPPKKQRTPMSVFSGGEARRIYLISVLARNPNFLLLDEPTNDLDIKTMENLEEYVASFPGCALIVSHDRAFLDMTCDYLFVIKGKRVELFPGSYSDYAKGLSEEKKQKESTETPKKGERLHTEKRSKGLTFKEKEEYSRLEAEIDALEKRVKELEEGFLAPAQNMKALKEEYGLAKESLSLKTERYFFLMEKAEGQRI